MPLSITAVLRAIIVWQRFWLVAGPSTGSLNWAAIIYLSSPLLLAALFHWRRAAGRVVWPAIDTPESPLNRLAP